MGQVHNGLERAGDLTAALKDALNATDSEGGLERFGETMTPVIDLWRQPEWYFLRNEKLCAILRVAPAVAAEFGAVALVNPSASRLLAVLEKCNFLPATAATQAKLQLAPEATITATLASSAVANVRDRRWNPAAPFSGCVTVIGSDPSATIGVDLETQQHATVQNVPFDSGLPVILPPGFGAVVVLQTVNVQITVNFGWRERAVFPNELG